MSSFNERVYLFPFKPLSVNELYGVRRGWGGKDRYLADEDYKPSIYNFMDIQDMLYYGGEKLTRQDNQWLYFQYYFYLSDKSFYMYNSTHIARQDVSNFLKGLEDGISEYLGIDDSYNKTLMATKMRSSLIGIDQDFTAVKIKVDEELNISDPLVENRVRNGLLKQLIDGQFKFD